jgi:hypothetical protein
MITGDIGSSRGSKCAPVDHESADKGKGNPWLAGILGEIVTGFAHRTNTFLGRYRGSFW